MGGDSPLAKGYIRQRRIPSLNPSYIDGGGFASLPQANAKGHDPSLIRCAFAEGKAPSYIDGGIRLFAAGKCEGLQS